MYSKRSTQQLLNKVTNRVQGNSGPGRNRNIDDDDDGLEVTNDCKTNRIIEISYDIINRLKLSIV